MTSHQSCQEAPSRLQKLLVAVVVDQKLIPSTVQQSDLNDTVDDEEKALPKLRRGTTGQEIEVNKATGD